MIQLRFHPFRLALLEPFTVSYGTRTHQETLIVALHDGQHSGFGEAPAIFYYGVTVQQFQDALEQHRDAIEAWNPADTTPEAFWETMAPRLATMPFALCALDCAAHDLYGKRLGQSLYQRWGYTLDTLPLSDYTLGIDEIPVMVRKMRDFPWPVYKIKLGTPDDIAMVRELRRHTQVPLRVDANAGWQPDQALRNIRAFQELNVELIEQPLPPADLEGARWLFERSPIPLMADESCQREADVATCAHHFHGINIKLAKCGGLTPARRMVAQARQLGLQVMVGCMTESTVGISAAAQLLPVLDFADLDTPMLLRTDVASGVRFEQGKVVYAQENGTGVRMLPTTEAERL
ncbi:L-alanine-DL-glutamate epimerase [Catalinimonas alkaloidigena]|uniref:Dipeptide epimerase n=1 Tax=Catalinimonas alkaloidigena TaxID=1075417 RepID=A0A1G9L0X6_9BACT|nr:dipeptide epimerase [Catalinimonas alkaloidigena]SDL55235.1 L-alanine-DL-glutamate epimerase [Catalinimonas alkaloidigena]